MDTQNPMGNALYVVTGKGADGYSLYRVVRVVWVHGDRVKYAEGADPDAIKIVSLKEWHAARPLAIGGDPANDEFVDDRQI